MRLPWTRRLPLEIENIKLRNRVAFLENELRQAVQANIDVTNAYAQQRRVLDIYRSQIAARDAAAVRKRGRAS